MMINLNLMFECGVKVTMTPIRGSDYVEILVSRDADNLVRFRIDKDGMERFSQVFDSAHRLSRTQGFSEDQLSTRSGSVPTDVDAR